MVAERFDPAPARAVARLAKVAERALGEAGLSLAQYRLLIYLSDGRLGARVLAERLAVSPPSVTSLVEALVDRGLVDRGSDPTDRRRVTHVLTPAGARALDAADRAVVAALTRLAGHVHDVDADTAARGLAAWVLALDSAQATWLREREHEHRHQPEPATEGTRA